MALTLPRASYWRPTPESRQKRSWPTERPDWLLSDSLTSYTWQVAGIGSQEPTTINFDVSLFDGRTLSSANLHLLEEVQWLTFWLRTGPMPSFESAVALAEAAKNLLTLAFWMVRNGIARFDELTPLDLDVFKGTAVHGKGALLEVDEQLEQYLEQLRCEACAVAAPAPTGALRSTSERRPRESQRNPDAELAINENNAEDGSVGVASAYIKAIQARLPLKLKRTLTLDHARLLEQAGLKGHGRYSSVRHVLRRFAAEVGLQTDIKTEDADEERQPVTTEHLRRSLMSFEYLYQYRTLLDDGLDFNPFPGSSAGEVAKHLGALSGRTLTVPPLQAMTFIERCMRWVLEYSEPLLALQHLGNENPNHLPEALAKVRLSGPGAPMLQAEAPPDSDTGESTSSPNCLYLDDALRFLATACAMTMATFSARRSFEIVSVKAGCSRRDASGEYWLTTFIHKSLRRDASIPVPAVVARAVEVLERLSAAARGITGTPFLLQLNQTGTAKCQWTTDSGHPSFPYAYYMNKFALYLDIPPLEDGSPWHFKPHQTRRFFAIVYIWIYEVGEFGALSAHLKHFDLSHTMRYVTEEEVGRIIRMVRRERTALILAKAAAGRGAVRTEHAGRLREMAVRTRDRLMLRMNVLPARKYLQRLERMVDLAGVTLTAAEFGFNAFGPEDISLVATSANQDSPAEFLAGTRQLHQRLATSTDASLAVRSASAGWLN